MQKEALEKNAILKLSFEFALMIIEYCEQLEAARRFVISRQLLRCWTSIGANVTEAQNAESKADFIHKMKIAGKEADESQYWLSLCAYSKNYPDCLLLQQKHEEISKVLTKIISTSKRKMPFHYLLSFFI